MTLDIAIIACRQWFEWTFKITSCLQAQHQRWMLFLRRVQHNACKTENYIICCLLAIFARIHPKKMPLECPAMLWIWPQAKSLNALRMHRQCFRWQLLERPDVSKEFNTYFVLQGVENSRYEMAAQKSNNDLPFLFLHRSTISTLAPGQRCNP